MCDLHAQEAFCSRGVSSGGLCLGSPLTKSLGRGGRGQLLALTA